MWKLYRASGMNSESPWFSLGYRKVDGTWGEKNRVRRAAGKSTNNAENLRKDVKAITTEIRRAGNMQLEDETGYRFELKALGVMEFNGRQIDHRF